MAIKPILFNKEMVRAILDGRKSCTRRVIKLPENMDGVPVGKSGDSNNPLGFMYPGGIKRPPYQPGDILYVRETWHKGLERYIYRADYSDTEKFYQGGKEIEMKWHPSIHMPKEAARIWLKVPDVRVERLQEITEEEAKAEGAKQCYEHVDRLENKPVTYLAEDGHGYYVLGFKNIWNNTIKKSDLDRYGWSANPWVRVIEFEQCDKPEGV